MKRSDWYKATLSAIGLPNLVKLQLGMKVGSPHLTHPVTVRPGTSDKMVFHQIFVDREYRCLDHLTNVRTIIDAGANVGYSSAYLLSRFPKAKLIAVEPDAGNFAILKTNLAPYDAQLVQGAVWDHRTKLNFAADTLAQGHEWGRQMQEGEGDVEAYDIPTLVQMAGFDRIDLLKIDVEGAEREIFGADTSWLDKVSNIVIELHGDDAERIFHKAIAPHGFDVSHCDELTVCLKRV